MVEQSETEGETASSGFLRCTMHTVPNHDTQFRVVGASVVLKGIHTLVEEAGMLGIPEQMLRNAIRSCMFSAIMSKHLCSVGDHESSF